MINSMVEMPRSGRRFSLIKPKGPYGKCPDCGGWKAIKAYRCRYCTPRILEAAERRWKPDAASNTKRKRAVARVALVSVCERCGQTKPTERHHIDGDTGNNDLPNLAILCRRCHMEIDGRLAKFSALKPRIKDPSPCSECGKVYKPLRRGLCHACNERKRRHLARALP
jgi:hypothetical protein